MSITMGTRTIGDGHPCFITFEAGATHTGVDSAISLVDVAADSGADAVKFQIFDPSRLVADRKQLFAYDLLVDRKTGATQGVEESLYDILVRRCMDQVGWRRVKKHADSRGLAFFATVGFEEDAEFVKELGCDSIKIGSADVNNIPLIRFAAQTGLCIQLDTGNATIGEIETAVDVVYATGNRRIIVHQCPSGYPARIPSIQLRMIQTLKAMFDFPIAYSDHTPGWEMDVAAVALGANLVEKTITHDRTTRSPEHIFSLEKEEAGEFVRIIRDVETAMGDPRRVMTPEQLEKRKMVRRSAFVRTAKRTGEALAAIDIEYRRPGTGVSPLEHDALVGMLLSRDVEAGTMLRWTDLRPAG